MKRFFLRFRHPSIQCKPNQLDDLKSSLSLSLLGSQETAFVQALTSASVMVEIAKACAQGNYAACDCGDLPSSNPRRKAKAPKGFVWDGCPHNFNYGAYATKRFMDPKKITNHAKKTKSHNQEVGRKVRVLRRKRV